MAETPRATQAADRMQSSVATLKNGLSSLPARQEQDDDGERLRGVVASGRSSSLMKSSWMGARFRTGVPTSCLTSVASPTMSMSDIWYETVSLGERLKQGDFIFDCPLAATSRMDTRET